jgi:hypothetical protein
MNNKFFEGDIVEVRNNKIYTIDRVVETLWFDETYKYRYHFIGEPNNVICKEEQIVKKINKD